MSDRQLVDVLFTFVLAHRVPAAFSSVSPMMLVKQSRARIVICLLIFAATAPIGALVLDPILEYGNVSVQKKPTGQVAGPFLCVGTRGRPAGRLDFKQHR